MEGTRTQQETLADWGGASLRGRWVSCRRVVRLGVEWLAAGPGRGELLLPGPALGKAQGEQACRAGEPSGQGEEPSPEGLGGHDLLTQADARCPTGQVMRHRLGGQPGGVGGEAARGAMVEADAVLEVAYRILDLGVAAVAGVVASIRCSFSGVGFLFQNHYPRSTGAPSYRFRTLTRRPPSVNSG